MVSFHFVTACNSKYFKRWLFLIQSIETFFKNDYSRNYFIHLFDLGLTDQEKEVVLQKVNQQDNIKFSYKLFDFTKYPDWVNINNNIGQWAWKPQCILEVMNSIEDFSSSYLFWFDSCNVVVNNLSELEILLNNSGIFSNMTSGFICNWCHPECVEYFINEKMIDQHSIDFMINQPMRNGALNCYYLGFDWVRDFIREYSHYSLVKEAIYPDGSSRDNHRQDQSILSILYYLYKSKYNFQIDDDNNFYGINIHVDRSTIK